MNPIVATFTWIGATFGETLVKEGIKLTWDAAQWKRAADRYAEKIEQDYGKLFLFGKDRYAPIDDIYTYVHVLKQEDAYFQFAEERLVELYRQRNLRYDPDKRRDGWRMVADGENLFILGDPGAGKTTFLKMAAIKAARGELRALEDAPARIPIFISLRQHASAGRSLYESVKHELDVCGFPDADLFMEHLLDSGRALLLWDGLDEVKTDNDQRSDLVAEMHDFMRKYDRCQYVISCRIAAADYTFGQRNLHYVKMAPFSDNQIERFLANWFRDKPKVAKACFKELQSERHKGLHELARTPILLTLLAIAYEETLTFPSRRIDIYYQAIDALLRKWDIDRGIRRGEEVYPGLELGYKWDLMTEIAAEAFYNGEFLLTREAWGERIREFLQALPGVSDGVDGGLVFDSIAVRHGLFVRQTPKLYSLAHLSFQEYFTARYIKENIQHGSLDRLLDHMGDDQWREVFLLTASSLRRRDAADFFKQFIARLEQMAAEGELIRQLLAWTQAKAEQAAVALKPAYRPVSMRAWYLALALALVLDRDSYHDRDRDLVLVLALDFVLDLDLDLDLVLDRDLARAFDFDFDLALARALDLARALVLDLALALDLDLDFARARARARARDLDFYFDLDFDQAKRLSQELGFVELGAQLEELTVPAEDASADEWQAFATRLETIIAASHDLSRIRYLRQWSAEDKRVIDGMPRDKAQVERYAAYLEGTALLLDCLELATVSNRRAIEERLLLPPA